MGKIDVWNLGEIELEMWAELSINDRWYRLCGQ